MSWGSRGRIILLIRTKCGEGIWEGCSQRYDGRGANQMRGAEFERNPFITLTRVFVKDLFFFCFKNCYFLFFFVVFVFWLLKGETRN